MSCSYVARKCRYRLHLYWCLYSHSGVIMRTRRFFQSLYSNPLPIDDLPRDLNCDIYVPPYGYFDRPHILHKLGIASWERFQHNASLDDLDRLIGLNEEAVQLAPEGHEEQVSIVACLGRSFLRRHEVFGELTDVGQPWIVERESRYGAR